MEEVEDRKEEREREREKGGGWGIFLERSQTSLESSEEIRPTEI